MNHCERMAIIGVNGSGKTTLLKMILGETEATTGNIWISESVRIGYLSQDVSDLPSSKTALEYTGLTDRNELSKARTIFANIGLNEEAYCPNWQFKPRRTHSNKTSFDAHE